MGGQLSAPRVMLSAPFWGNGTRNIAKGIGHATGILRFFWAYSGNHEWTRIHTNGDWNEAKGQQNQTGKQNHGGQNHRDWTDVLIGWQERKVCTSIGSGHLQLR